MSYYPEFAQIVEEALMRQDRSPTWLAQRLGVDRSTVNRWLNHGTRPRDAETVVRVADVLGITSQRQALLAAAGYGYQESRDDSVTATAAGANRATATPLHYTPFIGREQELDQISRYLADPQRRLLTIVGIGGVGKTRLAQEAVAQHETDFEDGVVVEPLLAVETEDEMARSLLRTLGLPQPRGDTAGEALARHLRKRRVLLVLDNYEHILPATGLIVQLLDEAPGLKLLITSRARLEPQQEYVLALEGLPVPPSLDRVGKVHPSRANLESYGSVSLFVHRARRVRPDFMLDDPAAVHVGEICRLLGGLPLGLELAASWVRAMPLAAIANQIQQGLDFLAESAPDLHERHRSLNAVFDHSWRMLAPGEQCVLRRLAVFRGSFDYEASVAMAEATPQTLLNLVDQSWLRFSVSERYDFHPLIHQYLNEKLAEDAVEEMQTRCRHMTYFAEMACRWDDQFWTGEQAAAGRIMPLEFANMMAAWRTAADAFDLAAMHDISKSFNPLGFRMGNRSHLMELCQEARAGLEKWLPDHPNRTSEAAGVLLQLRCFEAGSLVHLGRHIEARSAIEQILNWRQSVRSILAQPDAEMDALYWVLGKVEEAARNHDAAEEAFLKSAAYGAAEGTSRGRLRAASSVRSLADLNYERERFDRAEQYAIEAIALFEALGETRFRSDAMRTIARISFARGAYVRADQQFREILELRRELHDRQGIVRNVHLCGDSAAALGRCEEAVQFYEETLARAEEMGIHAGVASAHLGLARVALEEARFPAAENHLNQAQSYSRQSLEPDIEGWILCCRGDVNVACGNLTDAADAFQTALDRKPAFGRSTQVDAHCGLVRVAIQARDLREALDHCIAALRIAEEVDVAPAKLEGLQVVAELLAHAGRQNVAAELLTLVRNHPCASHRLQHCAADLLAAAALPVHQDSKHRADLDALNRALLPLLKDARAGLSAGGGQLYLDVEPLQLR